jgi:hypothetical protein
LAVALDSVAGPTVRLLAGFTVNVYARLPLSPAVPLSAAVIVNEDVPLVVGVPLSTPVLVFSENPEGKLPEETVNV